MPETSMVLCFSRDLCLLETRAAVLATKYEVIPINTMEELRNVPVGTIIDLVLLCHTLNEGECHSALQLIHQRWPAARILGMRTLGKGCSIENTDTAVSATDGPASLLRSIDGVLRSSTKSLSL